MEKKTNTEFPMGATLQGNSKNYEGATLSYDEAQKGSFNIMEKKQTAVEWLVEEINKNGEEIHKNGNWIPTHMIEQAKQMEKEQIEEAWHDGIMGGQCGTSEEYYNETYGDKK